MDIKFMLHSPAAQHPPQGRGTFYQFAKGAAQAAAPVPPLIPSPRGAGIQGQSVLLPRGAPPTLGTTLPPQMPQAWLLPLRIAAFWSLRAMFLKP